MIKLDKFSSFFVANWKLNGNFKFIDQFVEDIKLIKSNSKCVVLCPTSIHLDYISRKNKNFFVGCQNVSNHEQGAFTGEISPIALKELNIDFCIVGHSERRQFSKETNEEINLKSSTLIKNQIIPIICIGETFEEREKGLTNEILDKQIKEGVSNLSNQDNTIIAYEPVWAIGTGLTPSLEEIDRTHKFIRTCAKRFNKFKILYGGSVKDENAKEIIALPNVDGALIGGASLKSEEFKNIIQD